MGLDVVGVTVEAVLVVGDDHIGSVVPHEFREPGGAFLDGVRQKDPGASLPGQPIIPESA
ncbi:hypothetical protein SHKM778_01810 [Streptomyces sp. KM77-8]|uniref:Uncharacterized protein n=1 Tax=Streptomyces haneummycinicus TaxID=3074435 RepID=A0AAT9H945_9ACTN